MFCLPNTTDDSTFQDQILQTLGFIFDSHFDLFYLCITRLPHVEHLDKSVKE